MYFWRYKPHTDRTLYLPSSRIRHNTLIGLTVSLPRSLPLFRKRPKVRHFWKRDRLRFGGYTPVIWVSTFLYTYRVRSYSSDVGWSLIFTWRSQVPRLIWDPVSYLLPVSLGSFLVFRYLSSRHTSTPCHSRYLVSSPVVKFQYCCILSQSYGGRFLYVKWNRWLYYVEGPGIRLCRII